MKTAIVYLCHVFVTLGHNQVSRKVENGTYSTPIKCQFFSVPYNITINNDKKLVKPRPSLSRPVCYVLEAKAMAYALEAKDLSSRLVG